MKRIALAVVCLLFFAMANAATPQMTAFTYQGSLSVNGAPANGNFDLTFKLFDAATSGNQIGTPITLLGYSIANGRFSADLDFQTVFSGQQRWIEVTVGTTTLARQPVYTAPIAQGALTCCSSNTVVVPVVADPVQNGSNLLAAAAAIAAQSPSATNGFLLKLEPGTYDIGSTPLQMHAYVEIEGSGEDITTITGAGQASQTSGVVLAASSTQLRKLTVQSRSGATFSTAVYADNTVTSFSISHGTAQANGTSNVYGIQSLGSLSIEDATVVVSSSGTGIGIYSFGNATQIKNSSIQSTSTSSCTYGVYNVGSTALYNTNVVATTSANCGYGLASGGGTLTFNTGYANGSRYGAVALGGTIEVGNSELTGGTSGAVASGGTINVGNSQLTGGMYGAVALSGTIKVGLSKLTGSTAASSGVTLCPNSFNGNTYQPLNASCQ